MDGESKLPAPLLPGEPLTKTDLILPINSDYNISHPINTSRSSSSTSSKPDLLRDVQAAFKRHRPHGLMQSNITKPRRAVVPQRETSQSSDLNNDSVTDTSPNQEKFQRVRDYISQTKSTTSDRAESHEAASMMLPSSSGSIMSTREDNLKPFDVKRIQPVYSAGVQNNETISSALVEPGHISLVDGQKRVQFAPEIDTRSKGAGDQKATELDNLMSHISSLALTEMDLDASHGQDLKRPRFQNSILDNSSRSDAGISNSTVEKTSGIQDQLHKFGNFLQSESSNPMTQSSVVGSSCATTTLINSASAPKHNLTTYSDLNSQAMKVRDTAKPLPLSLNHQASSSVPGSQPETKNHNGSECKENESSKDPALADEKSTKGNNNPLQSDITDIKSQAPVSKDTSVDVKLENSKPVKQDNVNSNRVPRRKTYDPESFFKVNGKLYQRLGKIGSGGSSEVHKVISSECTIYALKRIKLKGRDYATAYGFCQEIQYLNKLKGKDYIIQLVDYEVTDKALLKEVMSGLMSNREGRFKEDEYIYMVLEYGEIDLAHMLSHKWKELDSSDQTIIDDNWLRFYWQQMLLAVNTIHEERIVHSDLKPANFLLVRGSLKLIDFGIAKAIMSDTTNIQRDAQVGTLSYMSPEAFLCNETDIDGNTIKCGRPSDIWSLGCILYQMVYGRTPFSESKTFWAKFKVITDPNHEIMFEPVSNPWLLDLMKKCLAWNRNQRWRIPELLNHPFLVPPPPSNPKDDKCRLLQLIVDSCGNDQKALDLYSEIQEALVASRPLVVDQHLKLLRDLLNLCVPPEEHH